MTQRVEAAAEARESVEQITASGGLRSLHPADGLFLRAEHLEQIQTYARELARAVAIASGTGVAYGYGLSLDGTKLYVQPGLAIDPSGRPLRSRDTLTLDLSALTVRGGRFWVVQVGSADPQPAGNEPVFGDLCADSCETRSSIQPWLDDAVRVQVVPNETLAGALGDDPRYLRNRLASAYFEQERRAAGPWLTPGVGGGGTVAPLLDWPWPVAVPNAAPAADAPVPIGALLMIDGAWVLDVWIARRDLDGTPARSGWESHLGWRPWPFFLAQVLQFQAQLAVSTQDTTAPVRNGAGGELFLAELMNKLPRSKKAVQEAWDRLLADYQSFVESGSLLDQGFQELPPAGFLAVAAGEGAEERIRRLFGKARVTVRHGSADAALRAVGEAQHLDRIPLTVDGDGKNPAVEVWIPDVPADLAAAATPSYGWVAFTRDRERCVAVPPATPVSDVVVYLYTLQGDETPTSIGERIARDYAAMVAAAGEPVAKLSYPANEWGVPADEEQQTRVKEAYEATRNGLALTGVVGTHVADVDRPLALLRAELLGVWLTGYPGTPTSTPLTTIDAQTGVVTAPEDTIWLIFRVAIG